MLRVQNTAMLFPKQHGPLVVEYPRVLLTKMFALSSIRQTTECQITVVCNAHRKYHGVLQYLGQTI